MTTPSDSHSILLTKNTTNGLVAISLKQMYIERTTDLLLCVHVAAKTLILKILRCYLTEYVKEMHLLKRVPHGQYDYFSTFSQSDHCFPAFPLPWLSPLGYL